MTQPTPQPRNDTRSSSDIVIGATVYGADNARFGQVAGSYRNYLIVERGFFMPVDYYVPMAAIGRVDQDLVVLSVSRDAALTQGWERPPFTSETGQRGLRRPAVGRPGGAPAAPGSPDAAASRQRPAGTGTSPNGWPVAAPGSQPADAAAANVSGSTAAPAPSPAPSEPVAPAASDDVGRQPANGTDGTARKETTAISPTAAFADTYAVGTNTDSYHALDDPNLVPETNDAGQAGSASSDVGESQVDQETGTDPVIEVAEATEAIAPEPDTPNAETAPDERRARAVSD